MKAQSADVHMGREGGVFTLKTRIFLPYPVEIVFPFFADAGNLESITPPWLQLCILTPLPIEMRAGAFIEYRLRLHGFRMRWLTEITAWQPPRRFVDEQRRGPYRTWIHEHTFAASEGGCDMTDFVCCDVAGGWIVNSLFVRHELRRIFEYRTRKLREFFP